MLLSQSSLRHYHMRTYGSHPYECGLHFYPNYTAIKYCDCILLSSDAIVLTKKQSIDKQRDGWKSGSYSAVSSEACECCHDG